MVTIATPTTLATKIARKIHTAARTRLRRRVRLLRVAYRGNSSLLRARARRPRGSAPQPLQVIERAILRGENVRYDAAEIDQDPTAVGIALRPSDTVSGFPGALDDRIRNRASLNVRAAVHDDECVGENRTASQIEDGDVFAFLFLRGASDDVDEIRLMWQCSSPL
jgi:hypothetical protein